jgi:hypothetical protein
VYALAIKDHDEAAFYDRALVGAGGHKRALRVSSGQEIVDWFKKFTSADQIDIHSHGFSGGVIGAGSDNGLYQHRHKGGAGSARSSQLATAIAGNSANFNKNAVIRFFGCNCTAIASEAAWHLAKYKRTDITVIGANGSVSPIRHGPQHGFQPGNRSFVLEGKHFDHYRGRDFVGSSKVLEW